MKNRKQPFSSRALVPFAACAAFLGAAFAGCALDGSSGPTPSASAGSGGSAQSGASSSFAASGGTGGSGPTGGLGATCLSDSDCGSLLHCLNAQSNDPIFGGGPAGGFCTKSCQENNDCPGTNAACLKNSDVEPGRCTLTCTIGPPLVEYDDAQMPGKCLGREDLRCQTVKGAGAVCLPTCGSDSQCGPGSSCDPRLAVCVTAPSAGLPTGAKCDPNASPTDCAGTCVGFDPGVSICSSPCVLGGDSVDPLDCGGADVGLCAFRPQENGAGDVGYCTPSCSAQSDCQNPDFWCFAVPIFTANTNKGYCFGATPCASQSDCDKANQMAPYTCTATPSGSYCLDTSFPLMGPGADGGVEAGGVDGGAGSGGSGSGASGSSGTGGGGP